MNEWPAGWYRDGEQVPSGGAGGVPGGPPGAFPPGAGANDVTMNSGQAWQGGSRTAGTPWPDQPPARSAPGGGRPRTVIPATPVRRGGRGRRVLRIVAALVVVVLILAIGGYFYLDSRLQRSNVLADYSGRPAEGAGQNWLITGSDSRQGLSVREERKLHTGIDIGGQRSDTILLLHIPANGNPPVLVSIPRDSYVPIPGNGSNKINAAFSIGGPKLLAQTLQNVTGLRIDHYMGIGFGGLVNVVNAVGGVTMCFHHRLFDRASGLHLHKGCQSLSGGEALAFVRTRHEFASQDLQREQNQRIFLKALLSKVTSPGTLINPFAVIPAGLGATGSLSVDEGTHLYQLISVAFALRHPQTTTVPIGNSNFASPAGDAVQWDRGRALQMFNDLRTDRRLPRSLITGSKLAG